MDLKRRRPGPGGEQGLSQLDEATVGYFRRVGDVLEQGFEQEEEKGLFITNVLGEVQGRELELCTNASVSKVLERFLAACGAPELRHFLVALQPHSAQLSCHRCGAHVVQTALLQVTRLGGQLQVVEEEETSGEGRSLEDLICQMSTGIRKNFLEHASDTHGTFVVRTLLQVLGGVVLAAENAKKISHKKAPPGTKSDVQPAKVTEFDVPDRFLEELRDLAKLLEANVKVFLTNPIASPVFKIALQVLERRLPTVSRGLCVAVIEYLRSLEQAEGCSPLLMFLKDKTGSRLLESIIQVSDKKLFTKLYRSHFKGQLVSLALHPIANFTVQRLLAAAPSQKLFSKLFDELCPVLEDILAQGHMGIITELAAACVKHKNKQSEIMMALYQAFHCCEPFSRRTACASLFLSLSTYEILYGLSEDDVTTEHQPSNEQCLKAVNYHGSLLTQHLLHFDNPAPVTSSLVAMPSGDQVRLACDQTGSHVFDALLTSSTVSDKQRMKVVRKLKGQFMQLACDRHGSRVLDQIWGSVSLKMKQIIAEELASREKELWSDPFGHHIARNLALTHFLKRRREWDEHQAAESKRRKMFAELLED